VTVRPASRKTSLLETPTGSLEFITTGSGSPATVFAHGLAGSIETTRPFGSGVRGSRTFFHFRGGSAAVETPWRYAGLADELRAVADHVGATQALGVSMGAGALCSLLAHTPLRFERLVFVMPAVLDRPRTDDALDRLVEMAQCVDSRDVQSLTVLLLAGEPVAMRHQPAVQLWCRRQAAAMVGTPVSRALRALPTAVPLADRGVLAAVTAPALVIAQEQDPAHPVWVAEQLAASLPDAHLEVMAPGGIMWRHRALVRDLVGGFLSGEAARPPRLGQPIGGRGD
jgi:Predicted hydrolases or acyltransferases (alpha/beta hydrolase superfamily)